MMSRTRAGFVVAFALLHYFLSFFQQAVGDPTDGFTSLPLSQSNFILHKPYDVSENQRYSYVDGVHKLWVYSTDSPFSQGSDTLPRTEIRIRVLFIFLFRRFLW